MKESCRRVPRAFGSAGLGVSGDEFEHAPPRVLRRLRVLLVAPVEEAMRRALVRDQLVFDAGLRELALEVRVRLRRDAGVRAGLEREYGRLHLSGAIDRPGRAVAPPARDAVETHSSREAVSRRGR